MGCIAGDAGSGDHIHLQEGAENIGIVIQDQLLQFYRDLASLCGIEFRGQLVDQRGDFFVFIGAEIIAHARETAGGEKVLGVSGRSRDQGGSVDVPAVHVRKKFAAVGSTVDVGLDADLLERGLYGLSQQGKFLAAGIGQPADRQLFAILLTDAVSVGILPSCLFQNLFSLFRIIGLCFYIFASEIAESIRESSVSGHSVPFQECCHKALLIDPHGNRFSDRGILDNRARHVHRREKGPGRRDGGELETVIFKIRIGFIGHSVGGVNVAGLQSSGKRIPIGKRANGQFIDLGRAVPVVFIFGQGQVIVRLHVGHHIGTCARDDPLVKIGGLNVNDAAVGIPQVIHQRRVGLAGGDRKDLAVCLNIRDLCVSRSPVMIGEQMLQAFLDSFSVHQTSAGKIHIVLQGDGPGQIAVVFPGFGQPGLQFHSICIMDKCLPDPVADAGPAIVGAVGIDGLLPVLCVEGRVADDHSLLTG